MIPVLQYKLSTTKNLSAFIFFAASRYSGLTCWEIVNNTAVVVVWAADSVARGARPAHVLLPEKRG